jgi:FKBP-type peptidyl-prolyl cis-trans isomerase SlyD
MQIAERTVVTFHYTLKNASGEVIDSSIGADPMPYLHGAGNIVPGLEAQMLGKRAGDKFQAIVAPEDGYGMPNQAMVQQVPRSAFPSGQALEVGMQFGVQTPQGPLAVTITKLEAEHVTIDGNHPLAGQSLHFDIEITEVRDATLEESLHGHAHGPGGHHHH